MFHSWECTPEDGILITLDTVVHGAIHTGICYVVMAQLLHCCVLVLMNFLHPDAEEPFYKCL
jgi:hypothetical protein